MCFVYSVGFPCYLMFQRANCNGMNATFVRRREDLPGSQGTAGSPVYRAGCVTLIVQDVVRMRLIVSKPNDCF